MKSFAFLVALLLASVAAMAQTVTFHLKPYPSGTVIRMVDSFKLDGTLTVLAQGAEQSFDMTNLEKKQYTRTVLETDGAEPVKYRIAYDMALEKEAQPMRGQKESTPPVTDSPYIFERQDDEAGIDSSALESRTVVMLKDWMVTREDGKSISEEEEEFLSGERRGQIESSLRNVLKDRTLEVGEELVLDEEMLTMMKTDLVRGDMQAQDVRLRLKALESESGFQTAVFDFVAKIAGSANVMEMEVEMKGVLRIGVDNLWPTFLELHGTVTGAGMHQGTTMGIDGDLHGLKQAAYSKN